MAKTPVPLQPGISYHFHIIYNAALSSLSETEDTDFSRDFVEYLVHKLESTGLRGFYHDRDSRFGRNIFDELNNLFDASKWTIVVLTPGFVRDCWTRYIKVSGFQKVLDRKNHDRVYVLAVGLAKHHIPTQLVNRKVVVFDADWEQNIRGWGRFLHCFRKYICSEDYTLPLEYQTPDRRPQRCGLRERYGDDRQTYTTSDYRKSTRDKYSALDNKLREKRSSKKMHGTREKEDPLTYDNGLDDKYYDLPNRRELARSRRQVSSCERPYYSYTDFDETDQEPRVGEYSARYFTESGNKYTRHDRSVTKQNKRRKDNANVADSQLLSKTDNDTNVFSGRSRYSDEQCFKIKTRETQTPDIPKLDAKHLFYIDVSNSDMSSSLSGVVSPRQLVYTEFEKEIIDKKYHLSNSGEAEHLYPTEMTMYDSGIGVGSSDLLKRGDGVNDDEIPVPVYPTEQTSKLSISTGMRSEHEVSAGDDANGIDTFNSPRAFSDVANVPKEEFTVNEVQECMMPVAQKLTSTWKCTDVGIGTNDFVNPSSADSSTDTKDLLQSVDSSIQTSNIMFNRYCNGDTDMYGSEKLSKEQNIGVDSYRPLPTNLISNCDYKEMQRVGTSETSLTRINSTGIPETAAYQTEEEFIQPFLSSRSHLQPRQYPYTLDNSGSHYQNKVFENIDTGDVLSQIIHQYELSSPEDITDDIIEYQHTEGCNTSPPIHQTHVDFHHSKRTEQKYPSYRDVNDIMYEQPLSIQNTRFHGSDRVRTDVRDDEGHILETPYFDDLSAITEPNDQNYTRYISTDSGVQSTVSADSVPDTHCFSLGSGGSDNQLANSDMDSSACTIVVPDIGDKNLPELTGANKHSYDVPVSLLQTIDSSYINNAPLSVDINNFHKDLDDERESDEKIIKNMFGDYQSDETRLRILPETQNRSESPTDIETEIPAQNTTCMKGANVVHSPKTTLGIKPLQMDGNKTDAMEKDKINITMRHTSNNPSDVTDLNLYEKTLNFAADGKPVVGSSQGEVTNERLCKDPTPGSQDSNQSYQNIEPDYVSDRAQTSPGNQFEKNVLLTNSVSDENECHLLETLTDTMSTPDKYCNYSIGFETFANDVSNEEGIKSVQSAAYERKRDSADVLNQENQNVSEEKECDLLKTPTDTMSSPDKYGDYSIGFESVTNDVSNEEGIKSEQNVAYERKRDSFDILNKQENSNLDDRNESDHQHVQNTLDNITYLVKPTPEGFVEKHYVLYVSSDPKHQKDESVYLTAEKTEHLEINDKATRDLIEDDSTLEIQSPVDEYAESDGNTSLSYSNNINANFNRTVNICSEAPFGDCQSIVKTQATEYKELVTVGNSCHWPQKVHPETSINEDGTFPTMTRRKGDERINNCITYKSAELVPHLHELNVVFAIEDTLPDTADHQYSKENDISYQYEEEKSDGLPLSNFSTSIPVTVSPPPVSTALSSVASSTNVSTTDSSAPNIDSDIRPSTAVKSYCRPESYQSHAIAVSPCLSSEVESVYSPTTDKEHEANWEEHIVKTYVADVVQSSVNKHHASDPSEAHIDDDNKQKLTGADVDIYRTEDTDADTQKANKDQDHMVSVSATPTHINWPMLFADGETVEVHSHQQDKSDHEDTFDRASALKNIENRLVIIADEEKKITQKKCDDVKCVNKSEINSQPKETAIEKSEASEVYCAVHAPRPDINWDLVYKTSVMTNLITAFKEPCNKNNVTAGDSRSYLLDNGGPFNDSVSERKSDILTYQASDTPLKYMGSGFNMFKSTCTSNVTLAEAGISPSLNTDRIPSDSERVTGDFVSRDESSLETDEDDHIREHKVTENEDEHAVQQDEITPSKAPSTDTYRHLSPDNTVVVSSDTTEYRFPIKTSVTEGVGKQDLNDILSEGVSLDTSLSDFPETIPAEAEERHDTSEEDIRIPLNAQSLETCRGISQDNDVMLSASEAGEDCHTKETAVSDHLDDQRAFHRDITVFSSIPSSETNTNLPLGDTLVTEQYYKGDELTKRDGTVDESTTRKHSEIPLTNVPLQTETIHPVISEYSSGVVPNIAAEYNNIDEIERIKASSVGEPINNWHKLLKVADIDVLNEISDDSIEHPLDTNSRVELKTMVDQLLNVVHEAETITKSKKQNRDVVDRIDGQQLTEIVESCTRAYAEPSIPAYDVLNSLSGNSQENSEVITCINEKSSEGSISHEIICHDDALSEPSGPSSEDIIEFHEASRDSEKDSISLDIDHVEPIVVETRFLNWKKLLKYLDEDDIGDETGENVQQTERVDRRVELKDIVEQLLDFSRVIEKKAKHNENANDANEDLKICAVQDWCTPIKLENSPIKFDMIEAMSNREMSVKSKATDNSKQPANGDKDKTVQVNATSSLVTETNTQSAKSQELETNVDSADSVGCTSSTDPPRNEVKEADILTHNNVNCQYSPSAIVETKVSEFMANELNEVRELTDNRDTVASEKTTCSVSFQNDTDNDIPPGDEVALVESNSGVEMLSPGDQNSTEKGFKSDMNYAETLQCETKIYDSTENVYDRTSPRSMKSNGYSNGDTRKTFRVQIIKKEQVEEAEISCADDKDVTHEELLSTSSLERSELLRTGNNPPTVSLHDVVQDEHLPESPVIRSPKKLFTSVPTQPSRKVTRNEESGRYSDNDSEAGSWVIISSESDGEETDDDKNDSTDTVVSVDVLNEINCEETRNSLTEPKHRPTSSTKSECVLWSDGVMAPTDKNIDTSDGNNADFSPSEQLNAFSITGANNSRNLTTTKTNICSSGETIPVDSDGSSVDSSNKKLQLSSSSNEIPAFTCDAECLYHISNSETKNLSPGVTDRVSSTHYKNSCITEKTVTTVGFPDDFSSNQSECLPFDEQITPLTASGVEHAINSHYISPGAEYLTDTSTSAPIADCYDDMITIEVYGSNSPEHRFRTECNDELAKEAHTVETTVFSQCDVIPESEELQATSDIPGGRPLYRSERHRRVDALQDIADFRLGDRSGASRQRHSSTMSAQPEQTETSSVLLSLYKAMVHVFATPEQPFL